jgi:2-dehydro-3-deoxyphosphogalactonate aldolase
MVTMPGVFTPTEALAACAAGASALKFFPASILGPAGISAIPRGVCQKTCAGRCGRRGVSNADFAAYAKVGIRTFGLGSSLYKDWHGSRRGCAQRRAIAAVAAFDALEESMSFERGLEISFSGTRH